MVGLAEQFSLVGDSLKRLYPSGETLADALQAAVGQTLVSGQAPPAALAMEVATSVLYLDASLEDGEFDHPLVATRVQRLATRIQHVSEGREAQPLEPWMEELYRRVSTARPWAAWCRNCARRCPRSKSRSTSISATRRSASC